MTHLHGLPFFHTMNKLSIIIFSLIMTRNGSMARRTLFLTIVANYSLLPLLFNADLLIIKMSLFLVYTIFIFYGIHSLNLSEENQCILSWYELFYMAGFFGIFLYEVYFQYVFRLNLKLPFLPLLFTSVYCSIGNMYFWLNYYFEFIFSKYFYVSTHKQSK